MDSTQIKPRARLRWQAVRSLLRDFIFACVLLGFHAPPCDARAPGSTGVIHGQSTANLDMAEAMRRIGQLDRGRHLLSSVGSPLEHDISFFYYGVFREVFTHFSDTNMSDFTLRPVNGTCSTGSDLPASVTDCATQNQLCCFNASISQVRQRLTACKSRNRGCGVCNL